MAQPSNLSINNNNFHYFYILSATDLIQTLNFITLFYCFSAPFTFVCIFFRKCSFLVRPVIACLHVGLSTLGLFLCCVFRVAETLLPGSKFHRYTRDSQSVVRSSAPYSVHDAVHQHLDFGEKYFYVCKRFSCYL